MAALVNILPLRLYSASLSWRLLCCSVAIVLLLLFTSGAQAYSSGAPDSRCFSMVPAHGTSQGTYPDPFRVTVSADTYSPLQLLKVTIEPKVANIYIRGFMVQARAANSRDSGDTLGFFIEGSGSKTACNSGAITHSYATDRSSVTMSWRAPASPPGDIVFRATVVRVYSDFYMAVDSPVISVKVPTTPPPATTTITPPTTSTSTTTTAPSTTTTTSTTTPRITTTTTTKRPISTEDNTSSLESSPAQSSPSSNTATTAETNSGPVDGANLSQSNALFLLVLLLLACHLFPL